MHFEKNAEQARFSSSTLDNNGPGLDLFASEIPWESLMADVHNRITPVSKTRGSIDGTS